MFSRVTTDQRQLAVFFFAAHNEKLRSLADALLFHVQTLLMSSSEMTQPLKPTIAPSPTPSLTENQQTQLFLKNPLTPVRG